MDNIQSMETLMLIFNGNDRDIVKILQNCHLLPTIRRCGARACRQYCTLIHNKGQPLNHMFRCPRCRRSSSLIKGTIFKQFKLKIPLIFYVMWSWACLLHAKQASYLCCPDHVAVRQFYKYLRNVCSWKLQQDPNLLCVGGVDRVVQIDKFVLTKRDNGQVSRQQWIIGLYDMTTEKSVMRYIGNQLTTITVEGIIKQLVLPGTEIWTSHWSGYSDLSVLDGVTPFVHQTTRRCSRYFIDPRTAGAPCTNGVHAFWLRLKRYLHTPEMESDQTPTQQQQQQLEQQPDSGISTSFNDQTTQQLIQSTPLTHNPRKRLYTSLLLTKTTTNLQINDTLIDELKDCHLENTPDKQRRLIGPTTTTTTSPLVERQRLLYGSNYIRPNYKFASPLKLSDCFSNNNNNNNRYINDNNGRDVKKLLVKLLNTDLIMDNIFKYLSDGDLYRFHMVSQQCRQALLKNHKATIRVDLFKERYKNNKENYVITPPPSPNKPSNNQSPPRLLPTDASKSFREFYGIARILAKPTQSTMKCPCCQMVAIVENHLSQCQNRFCGYIHCLLCNSYSKTGPLDFYDKCKNSQLDTALNDRSNYPINNNNNNNTREDSGIYSESEYTPKVKRNLFDTNLNQNQRIFGGNFNNNQSTTSATTTVGGCKRRATTWCPVIANPRRSDDGNWSSPERDVPKVCSKQSKRNLKRLTR